VLSTELTADLVREGLARETARAINDRRKDMNCQFTDRIEVAVVTEAEDLRAAIEQFADYIRGETLAVALHFDAIPGTEPVEVKVDEFPAVLYVKVAAGAA
jgi:isoleucyl-tRNA synthetase